MFDTFATLIVYKLSSSVFFPINIHLPRLYFHEAQYISDNLILYHGSHGPFISIADLPIKN